MTELFGTGFGTANYVRQRVVDYATVRWLLVAAIPFGIVGSLLALRIEADSLRLVFGLALIGLALTMLWFNLRPRLPAGPIIDQAKHPTVVRARDGNVYTYRVCNRIIGVPLAGVGSTLTGLMSAGLPEITTTQLIIRCRIPTRVAVATSLMVLTVTVFFAAAIHAVAGEPAWYVVVWSIPGVITGAQIGPRLQGKVPSQVAERVLAFFFVLVGVLVIALGSA